MTSNIRLIPRLDIKGPNLIKGIHLEGLRVVGDPEIYAKKYYDDGADELLYMDIVASLYGRNNLKEIIKKTVKNVFIPITVGGGVRSIDDVRDLLRSGAEKVAINTAAANNPDLIRNVARKFGSQCMVLSIEAKKINDNYWEVYTENGRQKTGMNVVDWAIKGCELGAGEILLTSVDQEGTKNGFDIELVESVSKNIPIPVIASGGMGKHEDALEVVTKAKADAISMADILHYDRTTIQEIRDFCHSHNIKVRRYEKKHKHN